MKGKVSYKSKPKKGLVTAIAVVALALVGGGLYMVLNNNLASQDASAGYTMGASHAGFSFNIREANTSTSTSRWRYTITGETTTCYTPNVNVRTVTKGTKVEVGEIDSDASDGTSFIILNLNPVTKCNNEKAVKISKTGVFEAKLGSQLRYVVQYPSKKVSIKTDAKTLEITGAVSKLAARLNNNEWQYNIATLKQKCYTVSTVPGSVKGQFNGVFYTRYVNNNESKCDTEGVEKVSLDGKAKITDRANPTVFQVADRFIYIDYLPKTLRAQVVKSGNVTLSYRYIGNDQWSYTASGCRMIGVNTRAIPNTKEEKTTTPSTLSVIVYCGDTGRITTRSGTFKAAENTEITLVVRGGDETLPTQKGSVTKDGVTLDYSYDATKGSWNYTASGCLILNIQTIAGSTPVEGRSPKANMTVRVYCGDTGNVKTKSGTFKAASNAEIILSVRGGLDTLPTEK